MRTSSIASVMLIASVAAIGSACGSDPSSTGDAQGGAGASNSEAGQGGDGGCGAESPCAAGASGSDGVVEVPGGCPTGQIEVRGECVTPQDCDPACQVGLGCHPTSGKCFTCEHPPSCGDEEGQTGRTLIRAAKAGAECLCETEPGYYWSSSAHAAVACDADADGWVTQAAQAAIDGSDPVLKLNARCDVRTVASVVLQNEAGAVHEVALEVALPLYESVRNDGGPGTEHPAYGEQTLPAAALNSLTKACVSTVGDFNDNGVPDVSEWDGSELGADLDWNAKLAGYFAEYARFAYYLELHDGWYEAGDAGSLRIVERQRGASDGRGVPVAYPVGADDYWQSCPRHIDIDYDSDAVSRAGGDFSALPDAAMMHTSQFKCVRVLDEEDYDSSASLEIAPELVFIDGAPVARRSAAGTTLHHDWVPNTCSAAASLTPAPNGAVLPQFGCEAASADGLQPGVYWMAVNFAPYASRELYQRGCIDQCAEAEAPVGECDTCAPAAFGRRGIEPKPRGSDCDGGVCDGFGTCGTCAPASLRCKPSDASVQQLCTAERVWQDNVNCPFTCNASSGTCYPACKPLSRKCVTVPQQCDDTGNWQSETACSTGYECIGEGVCLKSDGQPCTSDDECATASCSVSYRDQDGDGYGGKAEKWCGNTPPAGYVTDSSDCCDSDASAKPGQTAFFTVARAGCDGYDYNCVGGEELQNGSLTAVTGCGSMIGCRCPEGWFTSVPQCGTQGQYCSPPGATYSDRTQGCR